MILIFSHNRQKSMTEILSINNRLFILLLFAFLLVLAMPLHAGNQYLFPGDIIDQPEQTQYDAERINPYENKRHWRYSQESDISEKDTFYPGYSQYETMDDQSMYENKQFRQELFNKKQSDHYKYDDFDSTVPQRYYTEQPVQSYPKNNFDQEMHFPGGNYLRQPENIQYRNIQAPVSVNKMPRRHITKTFRKPVYVTDIKLDKYLTNKYPVKTNPNEFPANNYFPADQNNPLYGSQINSGRINNYDRQQVRIQYVPVPVYTVPGTLPGTVPGMVTPGNMVPGYSHLNPNYNFNKNDRNMDDLDSLMSSQYNPFSGLSIFPGTSNPFNSVYKSYSHSSQKGWPFLSPETISSGIFQSQ